MSANMSRLAEHFSLIAAGEYGLKHKYQEGPESVTISFHAGGYVEFDEDRILAVIEGTRPIAWQVYPDIRDFHPALKRIRNFLK
jgi:hypothetical protein